MAWQGFFVVVERVKYTLYLDLNQGWMLKIKKHPLKVTILVLKLKDD